MQANISPTAQGPSVNTNSGAYKKAHAAFFGEARAETESQGSNFQRNAAHFMGTDTPLCGERPFKINKTIPGEAAPAQNSYLNDKRLKEHETNMERDPKFKKNLKRFYACPSIPTNNKSSHHGGP